MSKLTELRAAATSAEANFETVLRQMYPSADRFTWFKACDANRKGTASRFDVQLATAAPIREAYDDYIHKLHEFYTARDGAGGVLGGRGL